MEIQDQNSADEQPLPEVSGTINKTQPMAIPASILLGSLIIAASVWYSGSQIVKKMSSGPVAAAQDSAGQVAGAQDNPNAPADIKLKADAPVLGKSDAKVTVVEFADFQCPFCGKFYQDVFTQLKSKYVDTGSVKFAYQDFAFLGQESNDAAEAAKCAQDQGKFWDYYNYLYSHQNGENKGAFAVANLKKFAATLNLNTAVFNQCMDSHKHQQDVATETNASKGYGVTGTPTVFINGQRFVGAQPLSAYTTAIDAALKK